MRTHKNQTAEDMAKEFVEKNKFNSAFPANYHSFLAGYKQKTAEIKDLIEKLELTKLTPTPYSGMSEKVAEKYNQEQDRKIELLKILL